MLKLSKICIAAFALQSVSVASAAATSSSDIVEVAAKVERNKKNSSYIILLVLLLTSLAVGLFVSGSGQDTPVSP